jgi:hypothetical protein
MKKAYTAVVQLLIDAEDEDSACDGISALLTEQMQKYTGEQSCLIDWMYKIHPDEVAIPDAYEPDVSPMPSIPLDQGCGTVKCSLCGEIASPETAHLHQDEWIGECCWDDRLKASE